MEVYSSSNRCPKCGGGDSKDSYHAADKGHDRKGNFQSCPGPYDGGHISRRCRRCRYVWAEACVDSAVKATD